MAPKVQPSSTSIKRARMQPIASLSLSVRQPSEEIPYRRLDDEGVSRTEVSLSLLLTMTQLE
jgi:hypothetical protein